MLRKIKAGLVQIDRKDFIGERGHLFFDVNTGKLFLSDEKTPGGLPVVYNADELSYDNDASGLIAVDVQSAIDEIVAAGGGTPTADTVTYNNDISGLIADDVQSAIDEIISTKTADNITYDNTVSGLAAINTQDAIDEIASQSGNIAENVIYDNTLSGLSAVNTQDAIDEIASQGGSSLNFPITTITTDTTLTSLQFTILADGTTNDILITLPSALSNIGRIYKIKRLDNSSNDVIITSSNNIENSSNIIIDQQYVSLTFQSDGNNWWII